MADIEATATIVVLTTCAECGGDLDHDLTTDRWGDNILAVKLCQECRDKAYDKGYDDGAEATT